MSEPMLSIEEERNAIRKWQDEGDRDSLEVLLRSHARQVYKFASRWTDNPTHRDDLVAEGMIGLMQAANRFDLARGVRFSSYAAKWILNGISAAFVRTRTVIDVPVRTYLDARAGRITSEANDFAKIVVLGVAEVSGEGVDEIASSTMTAEDMVACASDTEEQRRFLDSALIRLDPMDATVIRRLNLDDPVTSIGELAKEYGTSKDRLKQIEKRAMMKLRMELMCSGFRLEALG
jgi:RNA polymerase sigma factor (sigma-70 family)